MPIKDPLKLKTKRQKYYEKNREVCLARTKIWREKNPEYRKLYRIKNRDKVNAAERKYRKENPEKFRAIRRRRSFFGVRSFLKKPNYMFKNMVNSVRYYDSYKNKKVLFTKSEFVTWMLANEDYQRIFKTWEQSDYDLMLTPTIDRVDNKGHYSLDNIQVITHLDNSIKRDQ